MVNMTEEGRSELEQSVQEGATAEQSPAAPAETATPDPTAAPVEGATSTGTPLAQPETGLPNQPEAAAQAETAPAEPETPQQIAEQKARRRMFLILAEDYNLKDEALKKLHEQYDDQPLDSLIEFYNDLTPNWVYDPIAQSFDNPALLEQQAPDTAAAEDAGEEAEPPATEDEEGAEEAPAPADDVGEVEQVGEATKETEETAAVSKVIDSVYRQKAWQEFRSTILPDMIQTKFGDKYPPGTQFEDLDEEDQEAIKEEFQLFLQKNFMPRVAAGEFSDEKTKKTFLQKLKAAGIETIGKGIEGSSMVAFMRNLLLQDAYHSGSEVSGFTYEDGSDKGEAVDVQDFKELCNWSKEDGKTDKNKENWMLLCALLYRQLQETDKISTEEWTKPEALDLNNIKKHMNELFELCVESGKTKVNESLVKAFDSENGNTRFKKPRFAEAHATKNLIVHFQMMANHSDYADSFFGG